MNIKMFKVKIEIPNNNDKLRFSDRLTLPEDKNLYIELDEKSDYKIQNIIFNMKKTEKGDYYIITDGTSVLEVENIVKDILHQISITNYKIEVIFNGYDNIKIVEF